eukprot:gene41117-50163_t
MTTFLASYRAIVNNINRALNLPPDASNKDDVPLTANVPVEDPNIDTEDYSNKVQYDIISSDLLDSEFWPFSTQEVVKMSLTCPDSSKNPEQPISDEELREKYELLFRAGEEAVKRWHAKKKW